MIWIMIFISVSLGALGQIFMKIAMNKSGNIPLSSINELQTLEAFGVFLKNMYGYYFGAIFSIPMLLAILSYAISYVLWLGILSRIDLSFARPFVSFGYILVILYGYYAGEAMSTERVFGIVLICIGLFFVARGGMS